MSARNEFVFLFLFCCCCFCCPHIYFEKRRKVNIWQQTQLTRSQIPRTEELIRDMTLCILWQNTVRQHLPEWGFLWGVYTSGLRSQRKLWELQDFWWLLRTCKIFRPVESGRKYKKSPRLVFSCFSRAPLGNDDHANRNRLRRWHS